MVGFMRVSTRGKKKSLERGRKLLSKLLLTLLSRSGHAMLFEQNCSIYFDFFLAANSAKSALCKSEQFVFAGINLYRSDEAYH